MTSIPADTTSTRNSDTSINGMMDNIPEHIKAIERDGYVYIPGAFDREQISEALGLVKYWFNKTLSAQSDRMPRLNRNQPMVYNLQSKDILFVKMMLGNKLMEEILKHFLNDEWFTSLPHDAPNYILRSFLARSSNTKMPMHIDCFVPYTSSHVFVMQCAILLENQTKENGCTVLTPGSHVSGRYAPQDSYESAVPIEGKAGDVVFWDSRIWHGARPNETSSTRWSMIATFCRWWIKQAFDIPGNLPQEIYEQLTESQKAVMGFCSVPYDDETYGIDMKRGYEMLPSKVEDYRL